MSPTQKNREAQIKTPLGDDVLLLSEMTMSEELGRLFNIELKLLSTREDIKFEDLLGQNVTVSLNLANDEKRYFNGIVSRFSQSMNQGSFAVYSATVKPWLWFLTRTSDCRIFQEKTVPDIIKEVFRDHGYTDVEEKLSSDYRTWEYCVQYRETDFNFVSRLMENEGIYYYFLHEDGKHTLVLSDSYSSHETMNDHESIPFYPDDETVVRDEECISSWYISKQVQPGIYSLNDYDFERPKANLNVNSSIQEEHASSEFEIYDYPGEYIKSDDGDKYARSRIEELHSQFEQTQGQSDVRAFGAGALFKLTDYPRDDQNREYLITSVTHYIHSGDYQSSSEATSGPVYSNTFTVIESKTPFRSMRSTPKPVVQGPQTAIVVGPAGEDIYPDNYGRIKVQFHWDRYGKEDENSSCWVRVSQNRAGKGWGEIYIPHVGQEVIVSFLEGDPDRPIVTGRVYNGENKPPIELPAGKTQLAMRDHGGNEIIMEGTDGGQQIKIHSPHSGTIVTIGAPRNPPAGYSVATAAHQTYITGGNVDWKTEGNHHNNIKGNYSTFLAGNYSKVTQGNSTTELNGSSTSTVNGSSTSHTYGMTTSTLVGVSTSFCLGGQVNLTEALKLTQNIAGEVNIDLGKKIKVCEAGEITTGTKKLEKAIQLYEDVGEVLETYGLHNRKISELEEKITSVKQDIGNLDAKINKLSIKAEQYELVSDDICLNGASLIKLIGKMEFDGPIKTTNKMDINNGKLKIG